MRVNNGITWQLVGLEIQGSAQKLSHCNYLLEANNSQTISGQGHNFICEFFAVATV